MFDKFKLNRKQIGDKHEKAACKIIVKNGLQIVTTNYDCKMGEIDIIAKDKEDLVFIEVRYRRSQVYGGSIESVDRKKQQRIVRAAGHYLQTHKLANKTPCRFDVFAITGNLNQSNYNWIKGAFSSDF
ncbi:MAG: YraN family protein [Kangiellaceae bacterium]|nr:YraN family protein [Kangiellaceae bacterium]